MAEDGDGNRTIGGGGGNGSNITLEYLVLNSNSSHDDAGVFLYDDASANNDSVNPNGTSSPSVWIEWDDWDADLWTPAQRHLLTQGFVPHQVYTTLGVLLTLIVVFGFAANSIILYVFFR